MRRTPPAARAAFTLIELLTVVTIIAVLIGLSMVAFSKVRSITREATVRSDIQQLQAAVQSFKTKYQVDYLPSRIALREDGNYGAHNDAQIKALELRSLIYLKKVWPKLQAQIDWNNDGQITAGDAGSFVLEGDQCLVFFLGGKQAVAAGGYGCLGFSENKTNPMSGTPTGPIFDFPVDRTQIVGGNTYRSIYFATFLDRYGAMPYAYFSSKAGNDYTSDCPSLNVQPYFEMVGTTVRFHNRDSFQIICAGRDQAFGPGGAWSTAAGYPTGSPGEDDMANFYDKKLGVGSQAP